MQQHKPVMLQEVMQLIRPKFGLKVIDFTFGRGGHSKELLRYGADVYSLDRDIEAIKYSAKFEGSNFRSFHCLFSEARNHLEDYKYFDAALFDFGISSNQIDSQENGMSFKKDAPLRMTMGKNKISAYEVVNYFKEEQIADIIYKYGEERASRKIARRIVEMRKSKPISSTLELASIVSKVVGFSHKDPATRTFQAIRIYVNDELEEIESGLKNAQMLLKTGGILIAISFHSMEDRIVKRFFNKFERRSKVFLPSKEEISQNPRARSAKLRFACVM